MKIKLTVEVGIVVGKEVEDKRIDILDNSVESNGVDVGKEVAKTIIRLLKCLILTSGA